MKKEYPKLPKGFKKKWIKALKSGKYNQSKDWLKEKRNWQTFHCCLGVAGEVVGVKCMLDKGLFIPGIVIRGITKVPKILYGAENKNELVRELVSLNKTLTFEQIADWIDKNL